MSFDHRDPGTPESEWIAAADWAGVPHWLPSGFGSALVISAHPDDETLGAGGIIQALVDSGVEMALVVATDGDASHADAPADLGPRRRMEYLEAMTMLAPGASVHCLGLPDGGLRESSEPLRRELDRVRDGLVEPVLVIAPWSGDGHRDHRVSGSIAAELAAARGDALLEYPIWLWHWARPGSSAVPWDRFVAHRLSERQRERKRLALARFESQMVGEALGEEPILHEGMLEHFSRDRELFVLNGAMP